MSRTVVFDTYAIMTFLQDEPGADKVEGIIEAVGRKKVNGFINAVNMAEVFYINCRRADKAYAELLMNSLDEWGIKAVPANTEISLKAGEIKSANSMSLADAFAAATALLTKATLLTGDPEFKQIEGQIKIQWLP